MPFFKKSNKRRRVRKNRKTRRQRAGWGGMSYPVRKKTFSLQGGGWGGPVINTI